MNLLEMKHVKKSFDNLQVLRDISLEVKDGEIVSIIGPSGSGKSTLLRCATLLETMDSGTLKYEDTIVAENDPNGKAAYADKKTIRKVSSVFGLVFQQFNLFPHWNVMQNVTVLLFDEPTSALDPELTGEVLKVIKSLKDLKIAMVIVTHEMSFARDISDKVIFMADGVIVEQGSAEEVFNSENERMQAFLGRYKDIL